MDDYLRDIDGNHVCLGIGFTELKTADSLLRYIDLTKYEGEAGSAADEHLCAWGILEISCVMWPSPLRNPARLEAHIAPHVRKHAVRAGRQCLQSFLVPIKPIYPE